MADPTPIDEEHSQLPTDTVTSVSMELLSPAGSGRPPVRYRNSLIRSLWARIHLPLMIAYCRLFNISKPLVVVLTVNNNCNWNCVYCYGDYPSKGTERNLSTAQMVKIVDELVAMGCIYTIVHGGEALLRKDIGYIIDYLKSKGVYVGLVTNGQLFPKRINELRNVDSVTFSLDGRPENNDRNRGPGTFDLALNAAKLALAEGFKVRISCTLTRNNRGDLGYLAALAKQYGLPVSLSILFRTDPTDPKSEIYLTSDEIRSALTEVAALKRQGYPMFTSTANLEYALRWPYERFKRLYLFADEIPKDFRKLPCFYSKLKFHMEGDGTFMPCTVLSANAFEGKNAKDVGVREAVGHVHRTNTCMACPHLSQNEWNLLFGLNLSELLYLIKEMIKEMRWFRKTRQA